MHSEAAKIYKGQC